MKRTLTKILSVLLSASTLLFSVPVVSTNAAPEMWLDGEENGFQYRSHLNYGYIEITGYDANKTGVVEIPSEIAGQPVTTIGCRAFMGCGKTEKEYDAEESALEYRHGCPGCGITEIIIPDSVTTIQDGAFKDCESLTKIHFPSTLKDFYGTEENRVSSEYIGYASWIEGCDALKELTISETNPYYQSKNGMIYSKDGTTIGPVPPAISFDSVDFDGITAIGAFAFCSRESQRTDIEIPSQITSIGDYAFCGYGGSWYDETYDGIVNIKLHEGLTVIGDYAFSKIYHLEEIDLPDSLVSLGTGAFDSDFCLKSVVIPSKITIIPDALFKDCYQLQSVKLPEGITEIGKEAFHGPWNLIRMDFPSTLKKIDDYAFLNGTCDEYNKSKQGLTSIVIPDSVESIGQHAFEGNRMLKSVTLSKNLKKIEPHSFESCGLVSLEIPEGVIEIGDSAFYGNRLTSLKLPNTLLKIGNEAFRSSFAQIRGYNWDLGQAVYARNSVKIPDQIMEIGAYAFLNNYLSDIKLPDKAISCGIFAFSGNNLSSLIIPEGTTSMTLPLIMGNVELHRIYLPKSLKELSPLAIAKDGYYRLIALGTPYDIGSYGDFNNLVMVNEIYFAGTEAEWNALIKDWDFAEYNTDPSVMDNVTVHFNATVGTDVEGDVNADGIFSIADLVMMQRFLLHQGRLIDWNAGDLYEDAIINIIDLCLMKEKYWNTLPHLRADITNPVWNAENRTITANVTYENLPENSDAWIGVVPSDTPHNEQDANNAYIKYSSLKDFESGNFTGFEFSDNSLSGNYDLRIYANDNGGKELSCVTFYIDGPKAEITNVQWNPDTRTVTADVIYANFSDDNSAWIGVVPSDTPHNEQDADRADVNYIFLRNFESGAFPGITVPNDISGSYDLRIYSNDYNGSELACTNFKIT